MASISDPRGIESSNMASQDELATGDEQVSPETASTASEESNDELLDSQQSKVRQQRREFNKFLAADKPVTLDQPRPSMNEESPKTAAAEAIKIIDQARDYQQELFERAKDENIIAVLDTGSGKTLIACLLIKHVLAQELVHRSEGRPSKMVFFLANSVHLVNQQAAVLTANLLDVPVILVGDVRAEEWKKRDTWPGLLERNVPVVCTPAILQQVLDGNLISIDRISLLVFDEAHHTKKNHPYSRIMRSHYIGCPPERKPKVFGMTASPVDSKGRITTNISDLEQLLHSKIATTADMSILAFAPKPTNEMWWYDTLQMECNTDLYDALWPKCSSYAPTTRGFLFAQKATRELGSWCADQVWKYIFGTSEHESRRVIKAFEQSGDFAKIRGLGERQTALQNLEDAVALVLNHPYEDPLPTTRSLSTKVFKLYQELAHRYTTCPNTRTIVFVDQRLTAHVLHDCFTQLDVPNLRPGVLLGAATESLSVKRQDNILQQFRAGLINLVFATSVADEGIDIPQCNLCVRFDLYKSPIQYMQSRGRARMQGSIYAHLVEQGNIATQHEIEYAIDSESYIKNYCQRLPPDRLLGRGTRLQRMIAQDSANRTFKTDAGATCDFGNAMLIVARYASSLHHVGALEKETYEEEIDAVLKQFRFKVHLPQSSNEQIRGAVGEWRLNKQSAKRSAAFNCCVLLRLQGKLDGDLQSVHRKVKPANLNAKLALSATKSTYETVAKPTLWSSGIGSQPTHLRACIVRLTPAQQLTRTPSPMVLLTREPLPTLPSFTVYLESNIPTTVELIEVKHVIQLSWQDLEDLTTFTLDGVFLDVFNKKYQHEPKAMSYWLAPALLAPSASMDDCANIGDFVDVEAMQAVHHGRLQWSPASVISGGWTNQFLVDPLSGKYHYFTHEFNTTLNALDPVPDWIPVVPGKSRKNIVDFCDSFFRGGKKKAAGRHYDASQPVLSAELLTKRRNYLHLASAQDQLPIRCVIAPQPLEVSRLSPTVATFAFVWPVIIHRVESYLIALEGLNVVGINDISADLALEVFTKDVSEDDTETQTQVNTAGMGNNYERLEFLGDSLLKMMTTITVFNRTQCDEEGMHCRRMEVLCNRRLYDVSNEKYQLSQYIRTTSFNKTTWYPEHLTLLKGRGAKTPPEPVQHRETSEQLGMKTIADVSEAIIGAAVIAHQGQINPFDFAIRVISLLVDSPDHAITSWDEIRTMYEAPEWSLRQDDVHAEKLASDVHARTGYRFRHPRLLRSAFTHASDSNATVPDLQRLEFLGDAVLDWVCVAWLFDRNPGRNPQWLTEHKMAMVSNKFLAALAVTLDFDKFISLTTVSLHHDIMRYAGRVRSASTNIVDAQGRPARDFWTSIDAPPKALSDVVESYIGAVLIDSDWDYREIERFFDQHVRWFFEGISQYDGFASRQPTSYLHKKFGDEFKCRDFTVLGSDPQPGLIEVCITAGVLVHGRVIASAQGTSAKYAKVKASKKALDLVEGISPAEFRTKYGCRCQG